MSGQTNWKTCFFFFFVKDELCKKTHSFFFLEREWTTMRGIKQNIYFRLVESWKEKKKKEPKKESLSLFLSRTKCENKNGELFSLTILPLRYLHAIEILYIFFFILFLAFVLTVLDTMTTHNTFIVVPIDIIIIIIPYVQIDIADKRHIIIKLKRQT